MLPQLDSWDNILEVALDFRAPDPNKLDPRSLFSAPTFNEKIERVPEFSEHFGIVHQMEFRKEFRRSFSGAEFADGYHLQNPDKRWWKSFCCYTGEFFRPIFTRIGKPRNHKRSNGVTCDCPNISLVRFGTFKPTRRFLDLVRGYQANEDRYELASIISRKGFNPNVQAMMMVQILRQRCSSNRTRTYTIQPSPQFPPGFLRPIMIENRNPCAAYAPRPAPIFDQTTDFLLPIQEVEIDLPTYRPPPLSTAIRILDSYQHYCWHRSFAHPLIFLLYNAVMQEMMQARMRRRHNRTTNAQRRRLNRQYLALAQQREQNDDGIPDIDTFDVTESEVTVGGKGDCWQKLTPDRSLGGSTGRVTANRLSMALQKSLHNFSKINDPMLSPLKYRVLMSFQDDGDLHIDEVALKSDLIDDIGWMTIPEVVFFLSHNATKVVGNLSDKTRSFIDYANNRPCPAFASLSRMRQNAFNAVPQASLPTPHLPMPSRSAPSSLPSGKYTIPSRRSVHLSPASALASGKVLLGGDALIGESYNENIGICRESLGDHAINTHLPPSSNQYRALAKLLNRPLQYNPGGSAHDGAGTCRRAHAKTVQNLVEYGIVGMVSPSIEEWHATPYGVAWYHDPEGTIDHARVNRTCRSCNASRCKLLQHAIDEKRVAFGSIESAIALFKYHRCDFLVMTNIEPSISSHDILRIMSLADIKTGYSISNIDWNVLHNGEAYDPLTEQRTKTQKSTVYSTFKGGSGYEQPLAHVKSMFQPAISHHGGLRRTIITQAGASLLMELQVDRSGFASALCPQEDSHYLIPVPHPSRAVQYLSVEKEGFDRLLQLFRTTVDRNLSAARIQLRQSNVTYTISGTQLTPRLKVSAADAELLACWMVSYSQVQDAIADIATKKDEKAIETAKSDRDSLTSTVTSRLYKAVTATAVATTPMLGSISTISRWVSALQVDGVFQTLDEISSHAYMQIYGDNISFSDFMKRSYLKYAKIPKISSIISAIDSISRSTWLSAFTATAVVSRALLVVRETGIQTFSFFLDTCFHIGRAIGVDVSFVNKINNYLDTLHLPAGKIWADCIEAQNLPFQAACIQIVDSFINNWSVDPALFQQIRQEKNTFNVQIDDAPYCRFTTELKSWLTKFNSRCSRISRIHSLLDSVHERLRTCTSDQKEQLLELQKDLKTLVKQTIADTTLPVSIPTDSIFGGSQARPAPIPIPTPLAWTCNRNTPDQILSEVSLNNAFDSYATLSVDANNTDNFPHIDLPTQGRTLERLPSNEGVPDFDVIHQMMLTSSLAAHDTDERIDRIPINNQEVHTFSPDERGCRFVKNCIQSVDLTSTPLVPFTNDENLAGWIDNQPADVIAPVRRLVEAARHRINNTTKPYVAHIEGLPMGGKSKGVRSWIKNTDIVVVPTRQLREEWIDELGKLDPTQRATVVTQHTALGMVPARYLIVDEAYTYNIAHLELLKRGAGMGMITIGDSHQIGDVFTEDLPQWTPVHIRPILTFHTPVSFVPWDALYTSLRGCRSIVDRRRLFCGSTVKNGLLFQTSDQIIIPSSQDKVISGTQAMKARNIAAGSAGALTSHESQGSRSEYTFIHNSSSVGTCADLIFLNTADRKSHLFVTLTRARKGNVFIVQNNAAARQIPGIDLNLINGNSSRVEYLSAGTVFDLIEPITMDEVSVDHLQDEVLAPSFSLPESYDAEETVCSIVNPILDEAVPAECIEAYIDVKQVDRVSVPLETRPTSLNENMMMTGSQIPGNGPMQAMIRKTEPTRINHKHMAKSNKIINEIFRTIIDKDQFFSHLHLSRTHIESLKKPSLLAQASAGITRPELSGRFFPKNEYTKKISMIGSGNAFKTLSVTAFSNAQLAMFGDVCDRLNFAWARSQKEGRVSPVGFTRVEINKVLQSFSWSWESDISMQDQSHSPIHVAVFLNFVAMAADKLGHADLAQEIRERRTISDHESTLSFSMGCGLGSGDPWTLVANCIMACSVMVSRFILPIGMTMIQVGDDITCNMAPIPRSEPLAGSDKVKTKELTTAYIGNPSFTSFSSIAPDFSVPHRTRFIVKCGFVKRNLQQHDAWRSEFINLKLASAHLGISTVAACIAAINKSDPFVVEALLNRAFYVMNLSFEFIPENLKSADPGPTIAMYSRSWGCFGWALAHASESNISALNALNSYSEGVSISTAVDACEKYRVRYIIMNQNWSDRSSPPKVREQYSRINTFEPIIFLFTDHAVCCRRYQSSSYLRRDRIRHEHIDYSNEDWF